MKKNKIIKKIEGIFTKKDEITPAYINTNNPKYIEIDNIYYSGLIIVNYNRENIELILKKIIDENINMNISIFYEKQNPYKIIRDLTYNIANVGVDLKDGKTNAMEVDIAAFTYNDAKYIRKEIQVNNEDIYFLYIYLNIFSNNEKELEFLLNKVEEETEIVALLIGEEEDDESYFLPVYTSEEEANNAVEFFSQQEGSGEFEFDKATGADIVASYSEDEDFLGLAINAPDNGFIVFAETVHDCEE